LKHLTDSKLIRLLKLLSDKAFREFEYWLTAPWSQKNKYFLPLYKIIAQAAPNFLSDDLGKEKVYTELYAKKDYNNRIFNNLLLAFTKEVENYLAQLQLIQDDGLKQQLLGNVLLAHNEVKLFEATTQQYIQKLEKKEAKSTADHLLLHQLNESIYFQSSGHHRYQSEAPTLAAANAQLDAFYLLKKFKFLQEITARIKILQAAQEQVDDTLLVLITKLQTTVKLPALALYDYRLNQQKALDWDSYKQFKQLYTAAFPQLHFSFQQLFLFCCINDATALYSKGISKGINELNEWYQFGFKHQLLLQNDSISEVTYNNIILVTCHVGTPTFIRNFITTYKDKLSPAIQEEAYRWSIAQLDYVLGNYEQTFEQLIEWLPKNDLYAIQAKITLLKANFKLVLMNASHKDQFNSHCLAFEKYIKRNRLYSEDRSASYLKYIQYTRKICQKYYQTSKAPKWESLLQAIEREPILFGKRWLQEEIGLL